MTYYENKSNKQLSKPPPKSNAPSSPVQQQPKASTFASNASTLSSSRPKTHTLNPKALSFSRSSSSANSRSVSPSSSVSSAEPTSSQPTRSWWTLAEDRTGGCDQFLGFHKEKPRAGKFYYPVSELEARRTQLKAKSTSSEFEASAPGCERASNSGQISQPGPTTTPVILPSTTADTARAEKLSLPLVSPQQSSLPPSSTKHISSLASQACLQRVSPQQSSLPRLSTTDTFAQKSQSQASEEQTSFRVASPQPELKSTSLPQSYSLQASAKRNSPSSRPTLPQPLTKHISPQSTSHKLVSHQTASSSSSPLPISSPLPDPHSTFIMHNPANGFDAFMAWNNAKEPKSGAIKTQDSNKKITTTPTQPVKADAPTKVKATTDSQTTNSSRASTQHLLPHMRMKANNASSPPTSSDAFDVSPPPTGGMNVKGESTPANSLAGPRILPHMQVKMKEESPSTITSGGPGARILPHMKVKAKDESTPVKQPAGAGAQVLPHLKLKTKNETPLEVR